MMQTNPTEPLSLKQVNGGWENVKKRVRQKSGRAAIYLSYCQVVGLIEAPENPTVFIQAAKLSHYTALNAQGLKDIEWALSTEFYRPCRVRLLPPDAVPPMQNTSKTQEPDTAEDNKALTKQLVLSVWKSTKQQIKRTVPLVAAYMEHCHIVDVKESSDRPTIFLQTETQQIFESLKAYDRFKDIEAALTQELGIDCCIMLIPPNTTLNADPIS